MFYNQFLKDFSFLGKILSKWLNNEDNNKDLDKALEETCSGNRFFTPYMVKYAVNAIVSKYLNYEKLLQWTNTFKERDSETAQNSILNIGIIAAGNIPLVLFHDFLCVMATGNRAIIKLSSKDNLFFPAIVNLLCNINPIWSERIVFVNKIKPDAIDLLITMGSDKTAEAVKREYSAVKSLIRASRFSIAILDGNENVYELSALGDDIFTYFGLGCRSVSTIFIPYKYDLNMLTQILQPLKKIVESEFYMNIYIKNRAIAIMEQETFTDGGFFIIKKCDPQNVPIGIINCIRYDSNDAINRFEDKYKEQIQKKYRNFGVAQLPELFEYPDNKNTIEFIFGNSTKY